MYLFLRKILSRLKTSRTLYFQNDCSPLGPYPVILRLIMGPFGSPLWTFSILTDYYLSCIAYSIIQHYHSSLQYYQPLLILHKCCNIKVLGNMHCTHLWGWKWHEMGRWERVRIYAPSYMYYTHTYTSYTYTHTVRHTQIDGQDLEGGGGESSANSHTVQIKEASLDRSSYTIYSFTVHITKDIPMCRLIYK
jgi:hypothetical protein